MSHAGYATVTQAIEDLQRRGFRESFVVVGDELRAAGSRKTFRPDALVIREYHRFEGVSDPDDMSIVYAIEGRGGLRGILVDAFGVYANPAVTTFLARVPIHQPCEP